VRFAGTYRFTVSPEQIWETLAHFDSYQQWWAWLRDFTAVPGDSGLADGTQLLGTVVPPVPYRLSLRVRLDRCVPPSLVEATIEGDLTGEAVLRLTAAEEGAIVDAAWTLQPTSSPLRLASRIAHPIVMWGHDQVVAMAVAGFRQRALPVAQQ
jgi:uncharacterized protein YndB with AHSA1/START domain